MPKVVDNLVKKLLADKDFYPEKSEKEQEAIAWAIAYSKYNKSKKNNKSKKVKSLHNYSRKLEASKHYYESDELNKTIINILND